MATFGANPAGAANANQHPALVQPILFCGHGYNLYPLCSSSTSSAGQNAASSSSAALPKALLPILNRPMIAYPLQQLLSTGLRHAIILAPADQHQQIASALKSVILVPPVLTHARRPAAAAAAAAAVEEATRKPNISVTVGLSSPPASNPSAYLAGSALPSAATASSEAAVMRVDLLPLGPDDFTASAKNVSGDNPKRPRQLGTASLISWLHSIGRLTRDPLILPLDFIAQGVSLTTLINSHVTCVPEPPSLTSLFFERGAGEGTGKEREKDGPPKLFTVYDRVPLPSSTSSLHRILLLQDSDDVSDLDSSDMHIRMSLLWSYPHVRISTSLLDSHIYLFNLSNLIGLLSSPEGSKMKSLKDEVVPFLAKASWMHGLREKAGWNAQESPSYAQGTMHASREETSRVHRSTTYVDPALLHGRAENGHLSVQHARPSPLFTPDMSRAPSPRTKTVSLAPADREERKARARKSAAQVRCVALIERLSQTRNQPIEPGMTIDEVRQSEADDLASVDRFVARANTLPTYIECNRYLLRSLSPSPPGTVVPGALTHPLPIIASTTAEPVDPRAQVSSDSVVGDGTKVGERVMVKRSVVGRGCTIGRNAKITGSIIMDNVRIGENVKLENTILAASSVVEDRANLKDCTVAAAVVVPAGTSSKNETFDQEDEEADD